MKTRKIAFSVLVEIIPYFLIGLFGLIKISVLVGQLGSDMNGYYQFINQIISYLFLADMGFSVAVIYKLYKPFADDDREKIEEIYRGSLKINKIIGLVIMSLVIIMTIALPIAFNIPSDKALEVVVCFAVICMAYLFPYFFYSLTYHSLLCANQKKYMYSIVTNIIKLVCDIGIIILLFSSFKSLYAIAILIFLLKILEELIIIFIGRKVYPWIKMRGKKDTSAMGLTKDIIWHKIGGLAGSNVDQILIMVVLGPIMVSIYATYNFIVRFLQEMSNRIDYVVLHFFGNLFAKENNNRVYRLFNEYIILMVWIAFSIAITFHLAIRPFVFFWINGGDIDYILSYLTVSAFSVNLFINIMYSPLISGVSANGLYKESKWYVLGTTLLNIVVSIILILVLPDEYKLAGILISTAFAYFISIILRSRLLIRKVFEKERSSDLIFKFIKYLLYFILILILIKPFELLMQEISSVGMLLVMMLVVFIGVSLITIVVLYIANKDARILIKRLFSLIPRKKNKVEVK